MKPEFILNATEVERGLRLDRSDPEDRARIVGVIDILVGALEIAFDGGVERDDVLLWLDADIGEGSLYRAISSKIPTMLTYDFDVRDYLEEAIDEMSEITTMFKPQVLVLPVRNAATDMGQISAPSKSPKFSRSMSPIDKHIGVFDFASTFSVDIAWDIRKPRGEWPDPMLQSENGLRTITKFQDAGLDPSMWIMNLPSVRIVAETLSARTHIDDRNDIVACFALDTIFWTAYRTQNDDLDALPAAVSAAIDVIDTMPGNARTIIGAETYAACLNEFAQNSRTASDVAAALAARFIAISEALNVEKISV